MTYSTQDAQDAIDLLNSFWAGDAARGIIITGPSYTDVIDAVRNLVDAATYDPTVRLLFSSQGVFTNALSLEAASSEDIIQQYKAQANTGMFNFSSLIPGSQDAYYAGGPRYYMLAALKTAIVGGIWPEANQPDPTGLASWVGITDPAGAAIAHTIGYDPEVIVRGAALDLLKSVNWPVSWAQTLLGGLGALDDAIASSSWSTQDRASLSALSKDVRARALTAANAAQSHNFRTITASDGSQEDITIDAPGKPWYKNGKVLSAGALGILAGIGVAVERMKRRQ